jgi:tetratricopeptide (TPR) repeat protein
MTYDAIAAIAGMGADSSSGGDLDDALDELITRGLLHQSTTSQSIHPQLPITIFDLHPIVRRYAYDRLTAADRTGAHTRLVNYFESVPKPQKVNTLEDLAPVIELYHHMVRAGNLDEALKLFYDRLTKPTYYQFGAYQLRIELLRALFLDGEDKPPRLKDESAQAWTLTGLANSYSLSGQPRRAVPLFENANNNIYSKKAEYKKNLAIGLGNVATGHLVIGALSAAERNLRRQIDLCREIADEGWEAIGHQELGRVLSYRGMWQDAEENFLVAQKVLDELGTSQTNYGSVNWSYRALRFLFMAREEAIFDTRKSNNEYRISAIECAQRALELADETARISTPFELNYVEALWFLGTAYRASGNLEKAESHLNESISRCRKINLVMDEADILLDLARLRYAQGDFKDAQEKASEALVITERSGYVLQGADVNLFLAMLEESREQRGESSGGREMARKYAETALKLAHCDDGPPYYYKVAYEEAERMLERLK